MHQCFKTAAKDGIESPAVEEAVAMLIESGAVEEARTKVARAIGSKGIEYINKGCDEFIRLFGDNEDSMLIRELFVSMIPPSAKEKTGDADA